MIMEQAVTAADIIQERDFHRADQRICPRCEVDCSREGLVRVAYVFAGCSCDSAPYDHLVEQVWHQKCLSESAPEMVERELLESCLYWLRQYKRTRDLGLVERLKSALPDPAS